MIKQSTCLSVLVLASTIDKQTSENEKENTWAIITRPLERRQGAGRGFYGVEGQERRQRRLCSRCGVALCVTPLTKISCLKRGKNREGSSFAVGSFLLCSPFSVGEQSRTNSELPEPARSAVLKNQLILALSWGHFVPHFLFCLFFPFHYSFPMLCPKIIN